MFYAPKIIMSLAEEFNDSNDPELDKKFWKRKYPLPYWWTYIAWGLSVVSILVPAFFIILYSLDWGSTRSNAWLSALVLSIFQSTVIIQPIKV